MYYEKKNDKKIWFGIALILLIVIVLLLLNLTIKSDESLDSNYKATKTFIEFDKNDEIKKEEIIKNAVSCVVGISKLEQNGTSVFLKDSTSILGLGSGVIISENGYVLTNEHVTGEKYSNCYITLESGKTYNGSVVWADSNIDLAILKIEAFKLNYLELGDSDNINLGEDVYAIGNPIGFEFQRTVTKGIVSGINRTLKIEDSENPNNNVYMEDLIQTDSTINEGNSGGPLINENGKIIGINTVKLNQADGMGFAVPVNIVKPILEKLLQDNKFEEAYLGIFGYDSEVLPYLDKNINFENGIYIAKVIQNSPAYKEGIKEGDIILKIDNYEIEKMSELKRFIYQKAPGEEVELFIKRGNNETSINVILDKK